MKYRITLSIDIDANDEHDATVAAEEAAARLATIGHATTIEAVERVDGAARAEEE